MEHPVIWLYNTQFVDSFCCIRSITSSSSSPETEELPCKIDPILENESARSIQTSDIAKDNAHHTSRVIPAFENGFNLKSW
jgi:hypothetical protein